MLTSYLPTNHLDAKCYEEEGGCVDDVRGTGWRLSNCRFVFLRARVIGEGGCWFCFDACVALSAFDLSLNMRMIIDEGVIETSVVVGKLFVGWWFIHQLRLGKIFRTFWLPRMFHIAGILCESFRHSQRRKLENFEEVRVTRKIELLTMVCSMRNELDLQSIG